MFTPDDISDIRRFVKAAAPGKRVDLTDFNTEGKDYLWQGDQGDVRKNFQKFNVPPVASTNAPVAGTNAPVAGTNAPAMTLKMPVHKPTVLPGSGEKFFGVPVPQGEQPGFWESVGRTASSPFTWLTDLPRAAVGLSPGPSMLKNYSEGVAPFAAGVFGGVPELREQAYQKWRPTGPQGRGPIAGPYMEAHNQTLSNFAALPRWVNREIVQPTLGFRRMLQSPYYRNIMFPPSTPGER